MQGLYILGSQRETALPMTDGQGQYLGLNPSPGTGMPAGRHGMGPAGPAVRMGL